MLMREFIFPDVGEGIHEGVIVKWHITEGDQVNADQTIVEVETDKAIVELPSPNKGKIIKRNFKEGETVKVGQVLVLIGEENEKQVLVETPLQIAPKKETNKADDQHLTQEISNQGNLSVIATPSTRRIARELEVDLKKVRGTGPAGRITEEDVRGVSSGNLTRTEVSTPVVQMVAPKQLEQDQRVVLSSTRKAIAQRMTYSKTHIPHACGMDFFEVTHLTQIREREKKQFEHEGHKLTYLPFCIKAVALALKKYQRINANFDESTNELILKKNVNISIAVDTPEGLMAPVIKEADKKSVAQLAAEIERVAALAKERKLKLEDMKDGTFTITNVGSVGGMFSTPIINPPEVAIMGIHRIRDMPVVRNGKIEIGKVMGVSLCFDHRVIDGAEATMFVNQVKEYLEDPDLMMLNLE